MASKPRLNRIIELLESGQTVFGTRLNSGMTDDLLFVNKAGDDCLIIENEHEGMDFPMLRSSLQTLLDRKRIAASGSLQANPTPLVRISPNAHELHFNQWVIKQTLDQGPYGLILPQMETVEEAQAAVAACRYAQKKGVPDELPMGERGWSPRVAASYWGLSQEEYFERADLWPLDPNGELLLIPIVETVRGIANIGDILKNVKGIGAVWAGHGDMSISMQLGPNFKDPQVEEGLMKVLSACKQYNVPCATGYPSSKEQLQRRIEQGFRIFFAPSPFRRPAVLRPA